MFFAFLVVPALLCGCLLYQPQPTRFVDMDTEMSKLGIRDYRARGFGPRLILDITPVGGGFRGLDVFKAGSDLYFSPAYVVMFSPGPTFSARHTVHLDPTAQLGNAARFTVDVSTYGLARDWISHVYWVVLEKDPSYMIPGPQFWSEHERDPVGRQRMVVTR
jgi:hypothetical protein